jgi:DNA-binding response OmpR family regulator
MSEEQALVLVVDDNEMNRDMLSRRLERQGYRSIMAEDGVQALEMLPQHPIDLVLLDIMMPRMNGYDVLEKAKNDPALRHIPIIMISAVDDLDSVVKCVEMGADDYLFKPFNPILLKARISASLEKKRLRDQEQNFLHAGSSGGGDDTYAGLPTAAAERLRQGQATVADHFTEVTVLYASVIGLERVSEGFSPGEMVDLLNSLFGEFDQIAARNNMYRVKTIGSTYVAAGGVPTPNPEHAQNAAAMALDMQATINRWKTQKDGPLGLQIGLHTGSAVGGVIRAQNALSYDLWGEAVTIAALAGAASPIDGIAVTEAAATHLGNYRVEKGGQLMYQGTSIPVFLLAGRA